MTPEQIQTFALALTVANLDHDGTPAAAAACLAKNTEAKALGIDDFTAVLALAFQCARRLDPVFPEPPGP
jgi:hypothetical protein